MTDDRQSIIERLSQARVSDDLSHRATVADVDYLAGMGMASIRKRAGAALLDLELTLEAAKVGPALRETQAIARASARRLGWNAPPAKIRRIATEALRHYLKTPCSVCHGRGQLGVERDKPHEGRVRGCSACNGTGERRLPIKYQREIRIVLYAMERAREEIGGAVRKKMAR